MKIVNQPGKKIHDYIFVKELGKGAFGYFSQLSAQTGVLSQKRKDRPNSCC